MHPIAACFLFFVTALVPFWLISRKKYDVVADSEYNDPGSNHINALRGMAAILVALHHSVFAYNYYHGGSWSLIESGGDFILQA